MKRILVVVLTVLIVASIFGVSAAMAAKPDGSNDSKNVVEWSNGFPSGPHYNLNIHGNNACPDDEGGHSVFVPEDGLGLIQYVMNKKSTWADLYVKDKCSTGPNDPAIVLLPTGEYQVYVRIQGKPGNRNLGETRSVAFSPRLIEACDDNTTAPISGFGDFFNCADESLIGLGIVTGGGGFDLEGEELTRIVPVKGNNKAKEITDMFRWEGYIFDSQYDVWPVGDPDGFITLEDLNILKDPPYSLPVDVGDVGIDEYDLEQFCLNYGTHWGPDWIFNLADLVVYGWDYDNSGSKLVQVRFYPKDETVFVE